MSDVQKGNWQTPELQTLGVSRTLGGTTPIEFEGSFVQGTFGQLEGNVPRAS